MYTVKIAGMDVEFHCRDTQSVLDAARSQGVNIPWGCNGGGCGMCKIKLVKGNFSIGISSKAVLPDDERLQKYALACKTYPASDLEVIVGRRP